MKKTTYNLIVFLLLAVIVVGGGMLIFRNNGPEIEQTKPVEATEATEATAETQPVLLAPDITVEDMDGNAVKLSDFRGKPVVLNFWASWCGPCKAEMPEFEEAYHTYGEQVQFMMVDLVSGRSETKEMGLSVIQNAGYTFPVFFDVDQEASIAYEIYAIPLSVFIDANGEIVMKHEGMMSAEALEQAIQSIIPE